MAFYFHTNTGSRGCGKGLLIVTLNVCCHSDQWEESKESLNNPAGLWHTGSGRADTQLQAGGVPRGRAWHQRHLPRPVHRGDTQVRERPTRLTCRQRCNSGVSLGRWNSVRQCLREWLYSSQAKGRPQSGPESLSVSCPKRERMVTISPAWIK